MPLVRLAFNGDAQTIAARISCLRDRAVMPGQNFCALGDLDVFAGMVVLFPVDRVYPVAVVAGDKRPPVGTEDIFYILPVSFGLLKDFTNLPLVGAHACHDQICHRLCRQLDI